MKKYQIVLSDVPWSYTGSQTKWGAAKKFYETHSTEDLVEIGRPPLTKPGILFLWTTGPMLSEATWLIEEWGLHYRGCSFLWIKTTKDGVPWKARGVRPSIVKPLTEFVLAASTEAKGRPLKIAKGGESVVQTVFAPTREHSRKPDAVQERIERLYPTATKLEMFARHTREGWDSHGDEVPGDHDTSAR